MSLDAINDKHRLEYVHHILKEIWNVPFTKSKKYGLSALLTILPGGSTISLFIKIQYILIAHRNKFDKKIKHFLYKQLFIDWMLGIPPVIGTILTWLYNADGKIFQKLSTELSKI